MSMTLEGTSMLNELNGKNVAIYLGAVTGITDIVKGNVVQANEAWLKVKTNKQLEFVNLNMVRRIALID
jgi:hypothetical protein